MDHLTYRLLDIRLKALAKKNRRRVGVLFYRNDTEG